jgi:hypothetical protein
MGGIHETVENTIRDDAQMISRLWDFIDDNLLPPLSNNNL